MLSYSKLRIVCHTSSLNLKRANLKLGQYYETFIGIQHIFKKYELVSNDTQWRSIKICGMSFDILT